jgi:hypothetical protein
MVSIVMKRQVYFNGSALINRRGQPIPPISSRQKESGGNEEGCRASGA